VSFRLRPSLVARLRQHVRDFSGKNAHLSYMALGPFLESAIEREIQRTLQVAAGTLPDTPPSVSDVDPPPEEMVVRRINNSTNSKRSGSGRHLAP